MNTVVSTVCDNFESGTDENVFLKFKSYKFSSSGKNETYTCHTTILDTEIFGSRLNDWSRGSTQTWGYKRRANGIQDHNFLGSCAKDFLPYDQLMFQAVIPSGPSETGHYSPYDTLEICNLVVTFGANYPSQRKSSRWEWSEEEGALTEGSVWKGAQTGWLLLKRVWKLNCVNQNIQNTEQNLCVSAWTTFAEA